MRSDIGRLLGTGLAVSLFALSGCGRAPMAPELEPAGSAVTRGGAESLVLTQALQDPSIASENPVLAAPQKAGAQAVSVSAQIHGNDGGDVALAGVALHVPAGAFRGNATITLTLPDPSSLECAMTVTPASKNHFSVPATLSFDAAAINDVRAMVVYEFDAGEGMWVQLPCSVNAQGKVLAASVNHGSQYKADTEAVRRSAR